MKWADHLLTRRGSYHGSILNLVRSAVRHELARQHEMRIVRPGEHYVRTRKVGAASIRDEVIIHTSNPNSAENWVRQMFTDPPAYVSMDQATRYARARIEADLRWDGFLPLQRDDTPRKETRAMSPLQMLLLYSLLARPQAALPGCTDGATHDATIGLLQSEMIERTDKSVSGYKLSARAMVFLNAIDKTPLPVRQPAPWIMPEPRPQCGSRER